MEQRFLRLCLHAVHCRHRAQADRRQRLQLRSLTARLPVTADKLARSLERGNDVAAKCHSQSVAICHDPCPHLLVARLRKRSGACAESPPCRRLCPSGWRHDKRHDQRHRWRVYLRTEWCLPVLRNPGRNLSVPRCESGSDMARFSRTQSCLPLICRRSPPSDSQCGFG